MSQLPNSHLFNFPIPFSAPYKPPGGGTDYEQSCILDIRPQEISLAYNLRRQHAAF